MGPGAAFSEILQEKLGAYLVDEATTPAFRGFPAPPPLGFFSFEPGLRQSTSASVNPKRWQPSRPPRSPRILLPHQRRALDEFVALGARIEPDFTGDELRSAFRALAREYHPDRHPGTTQHERDRLSTLFARLHQAYEHLQRATETA